MGFGPRVGAGHLTPLTAAHALTMLRPRVAVPIHWGALRYADPMPVADGRLHAHTPHTFAEHAACLAPQTEVRVIPPGHSTAIKAPGKTLLS